MQLQRPAQLLQGKELFRREDSRSRLPARPLLQKRFAEDDGGLGRHPVVAAACDGPRSKSLPSPLDGDSLGKRLARRFNRDTSPPGHECPARDPRHQPQLVKRPEERFQRPLVEIDAHMHRTPAGDAICQPGALLRAALEAGAHTKARAELHAKSLVARRSNEVRVDQARTSLTARPPCGDRERHLDLIGLGMGLKQIRHHQAGNARDESRVHKHQAGGVACLALESPAEGSRNCGYVDQSRPSLRHQSLRAQPVVGYRVDDEVHAVERVAQSLRMVEVYEAEFFCRLRSASGTDNIPAAVRKSLRCDAAQHSLCPEHERPTPGVVHTEARLVHRQRIPVTLH